MNPPSASMTASILDRKQKSAHVISALGMAANSSAMTVFRVTTVLLRDLLMILSLAPTSRSQGTAVWTVRWPHILPSKVGQIVCQPCLCHLCNEHRDSILLKLVVAPLGSIEALGKLSGLTRYRYWLITMEKKRFLKNSFRFTNPQTTPNG